MEANHFLLVRFSWADSLEFRPLAKYRQIPLIMLFIQTDGEILSNLPFSLLRAFLDISQKNYKSYKLGKRCFNLHRLQLWE